jgi:hypothetical protein
MSKLYDWVFHFNHFNGLWSAIPRDVYNKYWDNDDVKGVLKSKDINTLIEMIVREIKVK